MMTTYPRLERLREQMNRAKQDMNSAGDRRDSLALDSAEAEYNRLWRKVANFKPTEKDRQEALAMYQEARERLTTELAQIERSIIELGGKT